MELYTYLIFSAKYFAMDFSKIISNDAPYIDQDTIGVMKKYQPVFSEYSILAE